MLIPQLLFALTAATVAVIPDVVAPVPPQEVLQKADAAKEIVATVESVNAAEKTIKVAEMSDPIFITDSTAFDDEVQLDKLRAGVKVKIVGAPAADGKFQATEIRVAK